MPEKSGEPSSAARMISPSMMAALQGGRLDCDMRVAFSPVVAAPREDAGAAFHKDDLAAIAIPFDFVGPGGAPGRISDKGRLHRLDEAERNHCLDRLAHRSTRTPDFALKMREERGVDNGAVVWAQDIRRKPIQVLGL